MTSSLDLSKDRLAIAFGKLEKIIDERFSSENRDQTKLLLDKLGNIKTEKEKLENNYSSLYEKYANMKLLNLEVVEELNISIKEIENILDSHGNNN